MSSGGNGAIFLDKLRPVYDGLWLFKGGGQIYAMFTGLSRQPQLTMHFLEDPFSRYQHYLHTGHVPFSQRFPEFDIPEGVQPNGRFVVTHNYPDIKPHPDREEYYAALLARLALAQGESLVFPERIETPGFKYIDFIKGGKRGDLKGFGGPKNPTQNFTRAFQRFLDELKATNSTVLAVFLDHRSFINPIKNFSDAEIEVSKELEARWRDPKYAFIEEIIYFVNGQLKTFKQRKPSI